MSKKTIPKKHTYPKTAKVLFGIVHGEGNGGSEREFNALNPAIKKGWERIATIIGDVFFDCGIHRMEGP